MYLQQSNGATGQGPETGQSQAKAAAVHYGQAEHRRSCSQDCLSGEAIIGGGKVVNAAAGLGPVAERTRRPNTA